MERYFEISEALIKSGGVIWDDHNGGSESKLLGVAALVAGDVAITVGLHKADYFSLNRVYLKDDKVHLSADSVGGTLFPVNFKDLWDCINDYNEKQVGNKYSCGTLENPMSLQPVPVTVITMTVAEFKAKSKARLDKAFNEAGGYEGLRAISVPQGDLVMLEKDEAGPWLLEQVAADGGRSEGAFLPPPRTAAEVEEMQTLVASGLSPEEANKQFISRRSGERVALLNDLFEKGTPVIGTPHPDAANPTLKL